MVQTVENLSNAAIKKAEKVKKSLGQYIVLSILAGFFVGIGVILIFSLGAPLNAVGSPNVKFIMSFNFSIALTLVIFAGSELFTGNNLVMTLGILKKKVSAMDVFRVWIFCYLGNLIGSVFIAFLVFKTGLIQGDLETFIIGASAGKMAEAPLALFVKGILCNILVCLAVWMCVKSKDEVAKLILIFLCLFAFIGIDLEHSIANMSLLSMGLFVGDAASGVSLTGFAYNLILVTLGNIVGGCSVALAYYYVTKDEEVV